MNAQAKQDGLKMAQEAHALTNEAFKLKTKAAHLKAAEAHYRLAFCSGLSQSASGNHIGQAKKHTQIANCK